ncbi:MAG TPA: cytochrome c oxidase subunit II [Candidatus Elarobacter sp.]
MHGQTWPSVATTQASVLASDWRIFTIAGLAVAVLVWGLILFAMARWGRARRTDALPPQFRRNNALEITWTAIPLVIVCALFVYTYHAEADVEALATHPDVRVHVNAYRWGWTFAYTGGPTIDGTAADPPQMLLPLGRTTRIELTTSDVTHAFWVPDFLFKRDAIPGIVNRFDLAPDKVGTFLGRCTQFCGLQHAHMTFTVRVVPPDAFDRWVHGGAS